MDISAVPYLLLSRNIELAFGDERVFVCLCLIDHLCVGVGKNRKTALQGMITELEKKYGEKWEDDPMQDEGEENDWEVDQTNLN